MEITAQEPRLDLLHQIWEMLGDIGRDPGTRKHFDLNVYFNGHFPIPGRRLPTPAEFLGTCGSIGCAMGFAQICIPELQDGFAFGWRPEAHSRLLGIDSDDFRDMFDPYNYDESSPTPAAVRARIAAVIDEYADL